MSEKAGGQDDRRDERAQHLGAEQLECRDRRDEQRLERTGLLLADDAVRASDIDAVTGMSTSITAKN